MTDLPDCTENLHRLLDIVSRKGITVSAAESCTGGSIGAAITSVPGSSSFFLGSAVTYANSAKEDLLKVPRGILFVYGAVSPQTAVAMARGAVGLYRSDIAVAVTGIAGPGGGTQEKPVGLVYIAVSDGKESKVEENRFTGGREEVRASTVCEALRLLAEFAEGL